MSRKSHGTKVRRRPVQDKRVYIVMPAYNEAAAIASVIKGLPETVKVGGKIYKTQAIVVDDCSRDKTHIEARKAGARVFRHVVNSGAGAATRTGLIYVSQQDDAAYAITIDADGQHKTSDVERLLDFAVKNNADMVVGNRLHEGNRLTMPIHRRLGNWGLTFISRILFGIKIQDTQSGLRVFKASALPAVTDYTIDRYGFCTEMLWLALRAGLDIREVPISVIYSKETLAKGQNNWGVIGLVLDLVWIRLER